MHFRPATNCAGLQRNSARRPPEGGAAVNDAKEFLAGLPGAGPELDDLIVKAFPGLNLTAPSRDLNEVARIEDELYRNGREVHYQDALWQVAPFCGEIYPGAGTIERLWSIIHADAGQKCRAALLALAMPDHQRVT